MWNAKRFRIKVKTAMAEKDWSQGDLAKHAKTTPTTISNLLTGKGEPTVETLSNIAAALGKSVSFMLGDDSVGENSSESKSVRNSRRVPA